jgi:hypothetical protein
VVVAPGRTVLLGWEHFDETGLPGFDALRLGLDTGAAKVGESAADAAVARLLRGEAVPYTLPFLEELTAVGIADRAADVALLTLAELAGRERDRERVLDPFPGERYRRLLRAALSALSTTPRASPP